MASATYQTVSKTGSTGTSDWVLLDVRQTPFNVSVHAEASGTLTYDVEVTGDDINGPDDSSPDSFKLASMTGLTATSVAALIGPVAAVRINITAYTSGTVTLHVRQGEVA